MLALLVAIAGCQGDARSPSTTDGSAPFVRLAEAGAPDGSASVSRPPREPILGLIPAPRTASTCAGSLPVDGSTEIIVDDDPDARAVGLRLAQWLGIGATLVRAIAPGGPGPAHAIVLRLEPSTSRRDPSALPPSDTKDEAYTLDISTEGAVLRAAHPAGLFYGAQTLAQLAGSRPLLTPAPAPAPARAHALPCAQISDEPTHRFRAMHLDVARHFFSKELVERYVDILAFYKFNVFHWHLTDDQGFRLAIRSHPELTQIGARRVDDGHEHAGFYTHDDAREVVAFAKARFITVIPEIEMPGHARAILASHPELSCTGKKLPVPSTWGVFEDVLCAGNDATFALLGDILRDTTEVFPSRLVHVGGDEVPKTRWNACPKCRARMAKDKLSAEQLQGAFMKRAGALLAARGRRMVAWDEALEGGLAKDGLVVAWQSAARGREAAAAGHDVVMAPSDTTYFNYWQSPARRSAAPEPGHQGYLPWTKVLAFDPAEGIASAAQREHVLGGEGALWTEYVRTSDDIDALLLPRLAALAEALSRSPSSTPDDARSSFAARFTAQRSALDASGVRYFVEPPVGLRPRKVFTETISLELATPSLHPDGQIRFTLDGSEPTSTSPLFNAPIALGATTAAAARLFLPGGRTSDVVRGTLERVTLRPPIQPSMEPSMLRQGVLYKYFEGDFRRLPDFTSPTFTPKRSGRLASLAFDPAFRAERFAVLYDAWVRVPADGVYRFVTHADDGVTLDVDGVRIIDDDGEHAARDADGEIALGHGPHTIRIGYFQGTGGKELTLACEGPNMPLGPCVLVSP